MTSARRVQVLDWDSAFFGFPIGRVQLDGATAEVLAEIEREAAELGLRCLYGSLHPADTEAAYLAQTFGHRLIEVGVSFARPAGRLDPGPGAPAVREGTMEDVERLEGAIQVLGRWSRYGADPRFGPDQACRMYRAWLERAVRDERRALLVTEDDDGITGLATVNAGDPPYMDLVATTKPGTGAARALFAGFVDWAGGGVTVARYAAARNVAIFRLLEKCGYSANDVRYTFHRWLDEQPMHGGEHGH